MFPRELTTVIEYLERSSDNREARCIVAGVCFAGGLVCVNTQQLKGFLKRCKSSINGSFQQLGYVALRTKAKARNCVLTVLPSLQNDQRVLRQWTVRVVSEEADFCFLSSFTRVALPEITDEDLVQERPPQKANATPSPPPQTVVQLPRQVMFAFPGADTHVSFKPKLLDNDLPGFADFDVAATAAACPPSSTSSVDSFKGVETDWGDPLWFHASHDQPFKKRADLRMKKSRSLERKFDGDWDLFGSGD
jgi:hypothetical protein